MDHSDEFPGDQPPPRRDHQNQKSPPPLKVNRGSHKIRKPPFPPPPPPPPPTYRPPVITYEVPPQVHHINPGGFMDLVQRLTGQPPSGPGSSSSAAAAMLPSQETAALIGGYGPSSSRPGSGAQQHGFFQPGSGSGGPGPNVFELPVQDQSPFIRQQQMYQQIQQYPDYEMSAPSSSTNDGFISQGQLTASNSSNDLMNTLAILFPQQEDDIDRDLNQ